MLFCHNTSRVATEPYPKLLQESGGRGFPHLVFMGPDGKVLAAHDGPRTVEGFAASLAKLTRLAEMRAKAATGDKAAAFDVTLLDLAGDRITADAATAQAAAFGALTPEQTTALAGAMDNARFRAIMAVPPKTPEGRKEISTKLLSIKTLGHAPTGENEARQFWSQILAAAMQAKDIPLADEAIGMMKKAYASEPRAKQMLDGADKRLADLKAGKDPNAGAESRGAAPVK